MNKISANEQHMSGAPVEQYGSKTTSEGSSTGHGQSQISGGEIDGEFELKSNLK